MEIIQATPSDLIEVLFLVRECVIKMNQDGMKQWNSAYPGPEMLKEEIESKNLFLAKELGIAKGLISFARDEPDEYQKIEWQNKEGKVLYIKLLAVHPLWHGKGISRILLDFAGNYAKENKFTLIRTDLLSENPLIKKLVDDSDFSKAGEYFSNFQKMPYQCFEKKI